VFLVKAGEIDDNVHEIIIMISATIVKQSDTLIATGHFSDRKCLKHALTDTLDKLGRRREGIHYGKQDKGMQVSTRETASRLKYMHLSEKN
jgi:hypothetical protein